VTFEDICWTVGLGVVVGVASIEIYDWSGRFAEKVLPMAARLWTKDPEWREIYAEAWRADIDDCPGKVWRFVTAASFFGRGLLRSLARTGTSVLEKARQRVAYEMSPTRREILRSRAALVLPLFSSVAGVIVTTSRLTDSFHLSSAWRVLITLVLIAGQGGLFLLGRRLADVVKRRRLRMMRRREREL
jgi:hypothetical protein